MARAAKLLLCVMLLAGCKSVPPAPVERPVGASGAEASVSNSAERGAVGGSQAARGGRRSRRARPAANSEPGEFDFYLLTLSWSPEFCATHPGSEECDSHPGFVVHGMWPQNSDGTYPENCSTVAGPANPEQHLDMIPTVSLVKHEWATHGTCSGLAPEAYFAAMRKAFRGVRIPEMFVNGRTPTMMAPSAVIGEFAAANPGWPRGSIALSCGKNYLTAVEVCLSKTLAPEVCQNVHSCGATVVKITPR